MRRSVSDVLLVQDDGTRTVHSTRIGRLNKISVSHIYYSVDNAGLTAGQACRPCLTQACECLAPGSSWTASDQSLTNSSANGLIIRVILNVVLEWTR